VVVKTTHHIGTAVKSRRDSVWGRSVTRWQQNPLTLCSSIIRVVPLGSESQYGSKKLSKSHTRKNFIACSLSWSWYFNLYSSGLCKSGYTTCCGECCMQLGMCSSRTRCAEKNVQAAIAHKSFSTSSVFRTAMKQPTEAFDPGVMRCLGLGVV